MLFERILISIFFLFIDLPRIKRDINNTVVLAEGDDLELSCKCQGKKNALVKWFFNGVNLNESSNNIAHNFFRDFNSTQYICKLANISKENEGSYTCLISNLAGTDELKYEVIVIGMIVFNFYYLSNTRLF